MAAFGRTKRIADLTDLEFRHGLLQTPCAMFVITIVSTSASRLLLLRMFYDVQSLFALAQACKLRAPLEAADE